MNRIALSDVEAGDKVTLRFNEGFAVTGEAERPAGVDGIKVGRLVVGPYGEVEYQYREDDSYRFGIEAHTVETGTGVPESHSWVAKTQDGFTISGNLENAENFNNSRQDPRIQLGRYMIDGYGIRDKYFDNDIKVENLKIKQYNMLPNQRAEV